MKLLSAELCAGNFSSSWLKLLANAKMQESF